MTSQKKERLSYFDIAKGLSMMAIILGHLSVWSITRVVFPFHVPIFFFISGYFLNTKRSWKETAIHNAKHLLLPYLYTCLSICMLSVPLNLLRGWDWKAELLKWVKASVYGAGSNSLILPSGIQMIGAIWFLLALFWGILLVRWVVDDLEHRIIVLFALAWISIKSVEKIFLPFSIQCGPTAGLFLLAGYLYKNKLQSEPATAEIQNKWIFLLSAVMWILCIYYFEGFSMVRNYSANGILDYLGAFCIIYCVLGISKYLAHFEHTKPMQYIIWFGKNSVFILCFHLIELSLFPWNIFWNKFEALQMPMFLQVLILFPIKVAGCSIGTYLLLKFVAPKLSSMRESFRRH